MNIFMHVNMFEAQAVSKLYIFSQTFTCTKFVFNVHTIGKPVMFIKPATVPEILYLKQLSVRFLLLACILINFQYLE